MSLENAPFVDVPPSEEELRAEARREFRIYLLAGVLVALLIGFAIGTLRGEGGYAPNTLEPPSNPALYCAPQPAEGTPRPTPTLRPLQVYVSGAVEAPDVVTLPPGSLVRDAVAAAGGASDAADLDAINLAAPLNDNEHVIVPARGSPPAPEGSGVTPRPAGTGKININTATATQLESLPRIGPAKAQEIVAYREAHGPFQSIEEIQNVSGIGPGIFSSIEPHITTGP
ncbi:MAG: ComEA family DNA-binding protein [Anaerolineales bacterium]